MNSFGKRDDDFLAPFKSLAIKLSAIGIAIWITSYIYFSCCIVMSERITKKTKVAYLRSILRQDISWFDSINP